MGNTGRAEDSTGRRLRDAVRRLIVAQGALDQLRRPCGTPLSVPHAWALLELQQAGELTVTALAQRLNVDRTNVSRLCARMEALGEVERRPCPSDGRALRLHLTRKGRNVAQRVDAASHRHFEAVAGRVTAPLGVVLESLEALAVALDPPGELS